MLNAGGNELLLTNDKISELNRNSDLPNADSSANTDQFAELGAIETNTDFMPLGKINNYSLQ